MIVTDMKEWRPAVLCALALFLLGAALVWLTGRTPAPVPATARPAEFSAERAMGHVRAIAQRPHPNGSAEHARVRQYLIDTLRTIGLDPQVQEATGVGTHNAVAARVQNVLVRVPGRNAGGPAVLLAAHYDGVPAGPAAGDDGAAVAALLETLRALRSAPPLTHDVIALFSDGEEGGLTGAAAFTREHAWARDVAVVLNFEGRGTGGRSLMFETGVGNRDTVGVFRHAPGATGTSLSVTVYRSLPNDTDLSELLTLGQPALNFAFADGLERYHTASDDITHLDPGSVQHHGVQALALARAFADGPLPRPRTDDAVFFDVPGLGVIMYPEWLAPPVAIASALLVIVAVLLLRRREQRWIRHICLGIAGIVLSTGLAASLAFGVIRLLARFDVAPPLGGAARSRAWFAVGITILAVAVASACWALVRRWASPAGARIGALLVWTIVALVTTWRLPGTSFLFVWPLLAAAAATIAALITQTPRARDMAHWAHRADWADWAATLVAAIMIVPAVYLVSVVIFGMSLPGALALGLIVPMCAWLLAPHLETLSTPRRWVAPLTGFAGGFLLIAIGMMTARTSATYPGPSMLGYAFDVDTARAWLVTPVDFARPGSWAATALGPSARVVVPLTQTAVDDPPEWLTRAMAGESAALAVAAEVVQVGLPELMLVADSTETGSRRLELRVRPAPGTYSIRLTAIDTQVRAASVDGRPIDSSRYRTRSVQWTLGYVAPPIDGFALALVIPRDTVLELDVIARLLGLPRLPNAAIPARTENVVPIHAGDQTVVHRRVRF